MSPNYPVSFDSNNLGDVDGVTFFNHDFNKLPNRILNMYKLARADKSVLTSSEYSSKEIPLYGEACGGSREDTEALILQVKSLVQGQNKKLVVDQANMEVAYTATMNEFNIEWDGPRATFEIIFIASDPIGKKTTAEVNVVNQAITTATSDISVVIDSSFKVQPVFRLTVTAVSGGTGQSVTISNGRIGQSITLTRNWTSGDTVVIDTENEEVIVNGGSSDFSGQFPTFDPYSQVVSYVDTFTTSRNVTLQMDYTKRVS